MNIFAAASRGLGRVEVGVKEAGRSIRAYVGEKNVYTYGNVGVIVDILKDVDF